MTIKKIKPENITQLTPEQVNQVGGGMQMSFSESWWGDCTTCEGTCFRYCQLYSTSHPC